MSAQQNCTTPPPRDGKATASLRVTKENGIIILSNANTTVGYCRYSEDGEVEYLFVQSARRRQGIASWLLAQVEEELGEPLRFRGPLSPAGAALVEAHARRTRGLDGATKPGAVV